jgi:hypothetical protein
VSLHNRVFFIENRKWMVLASVRAVTPKSSVKKYYRVDRREIHYLRFILEAYAGVAVMRTLDSQKGWVVLHVGPGCEEEVDMIICDLKRQMRIEVADDRGEEFV